MSAGRSHGKQHLGTEAFEPRASLALLLPRRRGWSSPPWPGGGGQASLPSLPLGAGLQEGDIALVTPNLGGAHLNEEVGEFGGQVPPIGLYVVLHQEAHSSDATERDWDL